MRNLKFSTWIYALYIENIYIENFNTPEAAKAYAKQCTNGANLAVFIKPIAVFEYEEGPSN